ncbi:MAG: TlpA disulfide reductase family protein [Phycisphaerales bacterium]
MLSLVESTRIAALACVVLAGPAGAQTAQEVLQRASNAIETNEQGRATVAMDVIASGRLAQAMPDGTAVVTWRRATDDAPDAWRVTGDLRNRKDAEPRSIDVLFIDGQPSYVDHDRKRLMKLAAGRSDATVSLTDRVVLPEFLDDRPLIEAFDGAELALDGTATHDGELCDVLVVTHPAGSGDDKPEYTLEKWMIARSDAFPRRVERTQDMSIFGDILITLDFSNVTLGDAIAGEPFELDVPEGYVGSANPRTTIRPATAEPAPAQQAQPAPRTDNPAAPSYSITDVDGATYDNTTQQGRVTVLYYWGSWCVPCRKFSPMVSELAADFADRDVDVLGLAIRERNPDAPKQIMADKNYAHTLALGAESTVRPFNVRVYPTIVVIGPDQTILASERPRKGTSAEETMAAVREAVTRGLGG